MTEMNLDERLARLEVDLDAHFDRLIRTLVIGGTVIFTTCLATLGAAIAGIFLAS